MHLATHYISAGAIPSGVIGAEEPAGDIVTRFGRELAPERSESPR